MQDILPSKVIVQLSLSPYSKIRAAVKSSSVAVNYENSININVIISTEECTQSSKTMSDRMILRYSKRPDEPFGSTFQSLYTSKVLFLFGIFVC